MSVVYSEMVRLSGRPRFGDLGHGEGQRFVVREVCEGAALQEEPEVECQELAVEGAVLGLRLPELTAEEGEGLPGALDVLLCM